MSACPFPEVGKYVLTPYMYKAQVTDLKYTAYTKMHEHAIKHVHEKK